MRDFKGIYGIVLTPFKDNGELDLNTLDQQAAKAAEASCLTGLVVCGSTGEFTRLSFDENIEIMKAVNRVNSGKKHFICGATAGDAYTANRYVEAITALNADGILLAPPYYFKLNDDEIMAYYSDVIRNNQAKIPIIGYNIPQCTNNVSVSVFEKLLEFDCVKGFKNSWNDMQEITSEIALRDKKRMDVSMFTGLDACLYGTLALGGDGIFSAITYLMPEIIDVIYSKFGKNEQAFKCQCALIELINVVNQFTFPYGYRVLSEALGNKLGIGRESVPLSEKNKSIMAKKEMYRIYEQICNNFI